MSETSHHRVLIIGGGTAGISVASKLCKSIEKSDIAILEPAEKHYYQPAWTLVGGGVLEKERTERSMNSVVPSGVTWIRDSAKELQPDNNNVITKGGKTLSYDFLVVAAGLEIVWNGIKGLAESIGNDSVCSIYDFNHAEKTWELIRNFTGGNAIFTQPKPPFKCPGAPQKIMYLADDTFRANGVRDKSSVTFAAPAPGIFAVKKYADALQPVLARKQIDTKYKYNLIGIRPDAREAVFENMDGGEELILKYDLLHVCPPMRAPAFIRESTISNEAGWMDVDKNTLQQPSYDNIFGLGDVTNTPNSKTAAAVRAQTPVLVSNLKAAMTNSKGDAHYDGYASCPLITGYGKVILAEFDYELKPKETFPFDQGKERRTMWLLKRYILPEYYWELLLKGKPMRKTRKGN